MFADLQSNAGNAVRNGEPTGLLRADSSHDANRASVKFGDLFSLLDIPAPADRRLLDVTFPVRKVSAGEALHRAGDAFRALYIVRSGFFKTVSVDASGTELVLGFPMGGEVLGFDGIDSDHYMSDVIALDISSVAVIPFAQLSQLAREHPCVERLLYSIFSREVAHKHTMLWLLGTLSAEARLARFLLDLSERFGRLGYSRTAFALRATRQEIGNHLGLTLETVSRTLSAFAAAGLVDIDRRQVVLRDLAGLRLVVDPTQRRGDAPRAKQSTTRATVRQRVRTSCHPAAFTFAA
jgi:CRP/FNR family transcriptional regulator